MEDATNASTLLNCRQEKIENVTPIITCISLQENVRHADLRKRFMLADSLALYLNIICDFTSRYKFFLEANALSLDILPYMYCINVKLVLFLDIVATTTEPTTNKPTTPPPIKCQLPEPPEELAYKVIGPGAESNATTPGTTVGEGTTIEYRCLDNNKKPMDGDILMNCTKDSQFGGRPPICVSCKSVDQYSV